MPRLSLISSVLNGRPYIEAMLASAPRDARIEHIAIDAGSSDGTLELLRKDSSIRLVERPGMPLYAAWNAAVAMARAPLVLFLNADDMLASGAWETILEAIERPADIYCGEAEAFRDDVGGEAVIVRYGGAALTGMELTAMTFGAPVINAKLFRRTFILEAGGFAETIRFAADRAFLLNLTLREPGATIRMIPATLYRYRMHAGSMTLHQDAARRMETAGEHIGIARMQLRRGALTPEQRAVLQAWEAHERAVLAFNALRSGAPGTARSALGALGSRGPAALARLARARRLRRRYKRALDAALRGRAG